MFEITAVGHMMSSQQQQSADHSNRYHRSRDSPEVVVHGLEEEFDVGFVQDLFEVRQGDAFRGHVDPDQVGGLLVLQVIDDPGLLHPVPRGAAGETPVCPVCSGPDVSVQRQQVADAPSLLRKPRRRQDTDSETHSFRCSPSK